MADDSGVYTRYVALGDSQTEGLWDGDDSTGLLGFADRLAMLLENHHPGVQYANLAVRGNQIRDVIDTQLPRALAMRPDLITTCVGMNDITRPASGVDRALEELDLLHDLLAETGATVVTTTFPDIARILPVGRLLAPRVRQVNEVIRAAAVRHGFRLVDLYTAPSMTDPQTWSPDRVHGSPRGHALFAAAAADALELPGSSNAWTLKRAHVQMPGLRSRMYSQVLWTQNLLKPWAWRHLRGRSSGDGRQPKHSQLHPVSRWLEAE